MTLSAIFAAFRIVVVPTDSGLPALSNSEKKNIERRLARGNLRLQSGAYVNAGEVDALRSRVLSGFGSR